MSGWYQDQLHDLRMIQSFVERYVRIRVQHLSERFDVLKYSYSHSTRLGSALTSFFIDSRSPVMLAHNIAQTSTPRPRDQGWYAVLLSDSG
jgi:hypothetical protein